MMNEVLKRAIDILAKEVEKRSLLCDDSGAIGIANDAISRAKSEIVTCYNTYVCEFPFIKKILDFDDNGEYYHWIPGCEMNNEDSEYYSENYFTFDLLGKRFLRVLGIVNLSDEYPRMSDRAIIQVWYQNPEFGKGKKTVRLVTVKKLDEMLLGFPHKIPIHSESLCMDEENYDNEWVPTPCMVHND